MWRGWVVNNRLIGNLDGHGLILGPIYCFHAKLDFLFRIYFEARELRSSNLLSNFQNCRNKC